MAMLRRKSTPNAFGTNSVRSGANRRWAVCWYCGYCGCCALQLMQSCSRLGSFDLFEWFVQKVVIDSDVASEAGIDVPNDVVR